MYTSSTPYDIYVDEHDKVIARFSTPGFSKDHLVVRFDNGCLGVKGSRPTPPPTSNIYAVKGIHDKPSFSTKVRIGKNYEVEGATYLDGMLQVTMKRIDTQDTGVVIPIS